MIQPAAPQPSLPAEPDSALPDGLPPGRRGLALAVLLVAVVLTVLDGAIANVALPSIARQLHATPSAAIWVVNAYQASLMVLLLPFASAGERLGYRRVQQAGMVVFTLASLLCALAPTLGLLVAARVLQGIGGAAVLSVNSALLRHIAPRATLGRAIGVLALTVSIAASVAPSLASAVLSVAPWPWLFAINVPFGLLALTGRWLLPESPTTHTVFDWTSAVLSAASLGLLLVAVDAIGRPNQPWRAPLALLAGVAGFWLLVRRQRSRVAPLLPIDLLRIPAFALAIGTSVGSFMAQTVAFVGLPFVLQDQFGHGQVVTGLLMTPWPVAAALCAPIAGRLADRRPAGLLCGAGLCVLATGLFGLADLPAHPATLWIGALMAICGGGFGFFQTPNNRAMLAATPRTRAGGASGMLSTARTIGQTFGAAAVALVFGAHGLHAGALVLALAAGIAAIAAAVSLSRLQLLA